jgi:hypothetical protein
MAPRSWRTTDSRAGRGKHWSVRDAGAKGRTGPTATPCGPKLGSICHIIWPARPRHTHGSDNCFCCPVGVHDHVDAGSNWSYRRRRFESHCGADDRCCGACWDGHRASRNAKITSNKRDASQIGSRRDRLSSQARRTTRGRRRARSGTPGLARAAEAGDPNAAFALATTYDPILLRARRVIGVAPDIAMARAWYEKAKEFGSIDAPRRLELLARAVKVE